MAHEVNGKRLTIFLDEYDRYRHGPLAEAVLERAREEGLAGATVLRGIEGFGSSGRLKTVRLLSSSDDLPLVIEIVDDRRRIESFLPIVSKMVQDGLVIVEEVSFNRHQPVGRHPLDDEIE